MLFPQTAPKRESFQLMLLLSPAEICKISPQNYGMSDSAPCLRWLLLFLSGAISYISAIIHAELGGFLYSSGSALLAVVQTNSLTVHCASLDISQIVLYVCSYLPGGGGGGLLQVYGNYSFLEKSFFFFFFL